MYDAAVSRPSVYLESSVVGYLTARPTNDVHSAARQHSTARWWDAARSDYDIYVSQLVLNEIAQGDEGAAARRLAVVSDLPLLDEDDNVRTLAARLMDAVGFPERAAADALHLAITIHHGVDFLLSWNLRHITNAVFRDRVVTFCHSINTPHPIICSPDELLGET